MTFQQIKTFIILATLVVWGRLTVHLVHLLVLQVFFPTAITQTTPQDKKASLRVNNSIPNVVSCQDSLQNQQP